MGETYKCDREFERKRRTNVCNSADVEDSPHNGVRLGLGRLRWGGFGPGGLGLVMGVGVLGSGGLWLGSAGELGGGWEIGVGGIGVGGLG